MFEITVTGHFDSAHYLNGYKGKCEEVHGHRFEVLVGVRGESLNEIGILYDFTELKAHLKEITGYLDHKPLNDLPPFKGRNPSSENLAVYIYGEMEARLKAPGVSLSFVEVHESPNNRVRFTP
jgi:6-pyruvoyltetrahydropterin/6-carboxytetrahydropterin synthase